MDTGKGSAAVAADERDSRDREVALQDLAPLAELPKGRWDRSWPVIACGAGLFSCGEQHPNLRATAIREWTRPDGGGAAEDVEGAC